MRRIIVGVFKRLAHVFSIPVILSEYFDPRTGGEYGIGFLAKLKLALTMARNYRRITTGSYVIEHLIMATRILKVPKSLDGCVVECGSFKGGSAANLSLVCGLCGRQLEIFDSFQGLPEPSSSDREHILMDAHQVHTYAKGAWRGTLEEVKGNISKYGSMGASNFHVGYFTETLPAFQRRCVLAFVDVDLRDSLESCLRYLCPLLHDGCYFFTHEAPHMEIAGLFFSEPWWVSNAGCKPPGLVGAGNGLGLLPDRGGFRSDLGYTVKNPGTMPLAVSPQTGTKAG